MQTFDDQRAHLGVWVLAADGTSRRLACSPTNGPGFPNIFARPPVAPDAIYFIATFSPMAIVRVPR